MLGRQYSVSACRWIVQKNNSPAESAGLLIVAVQRGGLRKPAAAFCLELIVHAGPDDVLMEADGGGSDAREAPHKGRITGAAGTGAAGRALETA